MANATQGDLTTFPEIIPFLEDQQEFEDGTYALIEQRVSGVYRQEVFQPLQEGSGVDRQVVVNSDKTPSRIFEVFKRLFVKTPPNAAESTQAGADAAAVSADQMEEEFPDETLEQADKGLFHQRTLLGVPKKLGPGVKEVLKEFFINTSATAAAAPDQSVPEERLSVPQSKEDIEDDFVTVNLPHLLYGARLMELPGLMASGWMKADARGVKVQKPEDFVLLKSRQGHIMGGYRHNYLLQDGDVRKEIDKMEFFLPGVGVRYAYVVHEDEKAVRKAINQALEAGDVEFLIGLSYVMSDK